MNEDTFNMEIRKFLKRVGVASQRAIEEAVRDALRAGKISGKERLKATMRLDVADIGLSSTIEGDIGLE